jgi:alpha-beta hydrolase superfamily lysophospholipase
MTEKKSFLRRFIKGCLWTVATVFVLLNINAAVHAYKFTHFYDSLPASKAEAEKTWWDKTGPLITGIDAAKKKITEFPSRSYETVILTTRDGLKLEAWDINIDSAKGTLIMFHGHGNNKAGILKEAEAFWQMGYNTLMVDFRAHGNSGGHTSTIGAAEVQDVLAAWNYIKPKTRKPVILYGISMGAASILHAMAQTNIDPDKLILEMPFGSLKQAVSGRLKLMHVPAEPMSTLLTFWGGVEHGFWAFNYKPFRDAQTVDCPVLLQWGAHDPRVKRSETESIYRNLSSLDKQMVVYEEAGHESLVKKQPGKWIRTVGKFLDE